MARWTPVFPAVLALVLASCGTGQAHTTDHHLRVVTTVSPITSIVADVGGGLVDIQGLVPEGADSHTFEPKPSAAKTLAGADVVFVNGLRLEDPTKELAAKNLRPGAEIVELGTQTITPAQQIFDFSFPRSAGKPNPHLWTDPPYAKRYAEIAADTLARRDPADAVAFHANEARFAAKVDELRDDVP